MVNQYRKISRNKGFASVEHATSGDGCRRGYSAPWCSGRESTRNLTLDGDGNRS